MKNVSLYARSNGYQRFTTKKMLDKFVHLIQWRADGFDKILDIGSGAGDVTIDLILPKLPVKFQRLVGCDISDEMIKYAQQHYYHPKVAYDKLDISGNIDEFQTKFGSFDHILSFFCLHWVRDQKAAFNNIHKLLSGNGDCLLLFAVNSDDIFTAYKDMSKLGKWSKYLNNFERYVPYQHKTKSGIDFEILCQSVGFSSSETIIQEARYTCKGYDEFENFHKSVSPFLGRLLVQEEKEFFSDLAQNVMAENEKNSEEKYLIKNNLVTIYAKK